MGVATPRALRHRIGLAFPDYEIAYRTARVGVAGPPIRKAEEQVNDILLWQWGQNLKPSESAVKVIVNRQNLKEWLGDDLDDFDLPYGPLTPLLRYRIASRSQRYTALTQDSRLVDIVDRDELARRTAISDLEHRLQ